MTWFDASTELGDLGWHEVKPIAGGVRRFERDDGHPLGWWELDRPLSDVAIAHNLATADAALELVPRQKESAEPS